MVIFGAGASYDSFAKAPPGTALIGAYPQQRTVGNRPPLAKELFDVRFGEYYGLFPECRPIVSLLQQSDISVEAELEKLQSRSDYQQGLVQLAAVRYYLQTMIWRCQNLWTHQVTNGVTNYDSLLDQIAKRPISRNKVLLVTFNYDTLLDDALSARGLRLQSLSDYVSSDFRLVKLHGSIDWVHEIIDFKFTVPSPAKHLIHQIIKEAASLRIKSDSFQMVSPDPFQRPAEKPLYPALSIPVENKSGYECPAEHLKALEDSLPQVNKVLVIGWRAGENRFLEMLGKGIAKEAEFMIVSSNRESATEVASKIRHAVRPRVQGELIAAETSFSHFTFSRELDSFLIEV